jgi:hypothetical protein
MGQPPAAPAAIARFGTVTGIAGTPFIRASRPR